jgi:thiamine pyrophosphate-dependent acetolactate synthase large subunit-like protein
MTITGADAVVRVLEAAGVRVVFGLPGVHNLALWRSLAESRIRLVGVRHEQAAAYAADGYARASGQVGVALTTTGPGAANTLAAVGEAWASGSPVVVIATAIPTTLRRPGVYRGVLHETTDQRAMFVPVTKDAMQVRTADEIIVTVSEAIVTALSAPSRPVYVEIPTDLLGVPVRDEPVEAPVLRLPDSPPTEMVEAAAQMLDRAERPLVWAGGGALRAGAGAAVSDLATRLSAPVLTTYQAQGLLPPDHPCLVGLPPHVEAAGNLWDAADVVVVIGSDLDGMTTQNWRMPPPPTLIAINVDLVDASKNYAPDVTIVGDAAVACAELASRVRARGHVAELGVRLAAMRDTFRSRLAREDPDALGFLEAVADALPSEAVVVVDMCIPGYWLGGFHAVPGPRQLAYPVGWGTLGFAFPAALGASLAVSGPVVSISGDGGFLFACGELATMAQERLPLTAVIVDDGGYGMLRFDQRHAGDATFGVDLWTPDFVAMAASFGVKAAHVEGLGDAFRVALAEHVSNEEPSVLVVTAALDPPLTTSPRWYRT